MRRPKVKWIVKNVWVVGMLFLIAIILLQMNVIFDLKREVMIYELKEHVFINQVKVGDTLMFSDTTRIHLNKKKTQIDKF
jgi:hypothetical protein